MTKKSFILHTDTYQHIKLLSNDDKATLLDAVFAHAEGESVYVEGMAGMAFSFIKSQMDRDKEKWEKRAAASRENGSRGGRPKKEDNLDKPIGSSSNLPEPTKPVSVNVTVSGNVNASGIVTDIKQEELFDRFWNSYHYKKSRPLAELAFKKAIKKTTIEIMEASIIEYDKSLRTSDVSKKHPTTWLNQECWLDEYKPTNGTQARSKVKCI